MAVGAIGDGFGVAVEVGGGVAVGAIGDGLDVAVEVGDGSGVFVAVGMGVGVGSGKDGKSRSSSRTIPKTNVHSKHTSPVNSLTIA